ncbi:WXG100 family type VII secretion target [Saccharopolyspora sp. NPDC000359]|uniref:WXG100 family type VII secretion target n=1 Tax=Saccharopolyspora sp. NPDC000359 TaxID=3154251 RepID=UPI00332D7312
MSHNPLIAEPQDSSEWYTGIGIVEAVADVGEAIASGNWVEAGYALLGAGLEALSAVLDPIGTGISWAVAWLIEYVQPLTDILDWLAGNADAVAAHAQTWRNVGDSLQATADAMQGDVNRDTAGWTGAAADAYRARLATTTELIRAQSEAAKALAAGTEMSGMLVGTIREVVRDLIADCIGRLVAWAIEASTGIGIAAVAVQATARVARWGARIMQVVQKLLTSLKNLLPLIDRLADLLTRIRRILNKITQDSPHPTPPGKPPNNPSNPGNPPPRDPNNPNDPPDDPPDDDDIGPADTPEDRQRLIEEALAQGHKISPDKVVEIGKDPNGRIVWLEEGKGGEGGRGLEHIHERHDKDFAKFEVPPEDIASLSHRAATEGVYTGYRLGKGKTPRPIFEVDYNGKTIPVAVTVGSNGFIVSAQPVFDDMLKRARPDPGFHTNPHSRGW